MTTWFKIAFRSLLKNRRRSLFTVLAVGIGFSAVNVFGGFTEYIFSSLQESFIYAEGNGHITIFKEGFRTKGKIDPVSYLITEDEIKDISEALVEFPEVLLVTPQLHISGLVSNGEVSPIFMGVGRVPSHTKFIFDQAQGLIKTLKLFEGKPLQDDVIFGVGLSSGLADQLQLQLGSNAVVMAPTVDGQINALDLQVYQTFDAPFELLNDKLMLIPLSFAQSLYDTTSVDRLTILLNDTKHTQQMKERLQALAQKNGWKLEIISWKELSFFYNKVKDMFEVIFLFIGLIVFVIAVMSVVNTIGMSVMERTKEIGTIRALGVKRRGIITLFSIESTILGLIGVSFGMIITLSNWLMVKMTKPTWSPPMITGEEPLEVHLVPEYLLISTLLMILLSIGAALMPARKASHLGIVDALGHT